MMLTVYLRYQRGLTGTKIVCAEGDCGACTVLRVFPMTRVAKTLQFEAINACIITMAQLDGSHLVTIEALASEHSLSAVQEAVVRNHGAQCGFCTPGMVMALTGFFQKDRPELSEQLVKNHLTGNLCRCTGYTSLLTAAQSVDPKQVPLLNPRYLQARALTDTKDVTKIPLHIKTEAHEFLAPVSLKDAVSLRKKNGSLRLISSGTDLGVQVNKGAAIPAALLSLHLIPELYKITSLGGRVRVGARVNLSELRRYCAQKIPEFASFLDIFASPQIKNLATLVGNIANASPIGDTLPFLLVTEGIVHLVGGTKPRDLAMLDLYSGYRQLTLKPREFISHVSFKIPQQQDCLRLYKVSQRKDLDISAVNCAFLFQTTGSDHKAAAKIKTARIAYGGVAANVQRCEEAEAYLLGKTLTEETQGKALELIQAALSPQTDLRGSLAYRRVMIESLFRRYCGELWQRDDRHAAT
ncbi:MAG: FAD binding domain-containing protein [Proteobacteria bacterium]|nr:FAD binding domain-containing protein [Pseudomonadota bacterium]